MNSSQEYSTLGAITEEKPRGLLTINDETADIPYDQPPAHLEQDWVGSIDPLIKEILEGYRESETQSNSDLYRYREQTDQVFLLDQADLAYLVRQESTWGIAGLN